MDNVSKTLNQICVFVLCYLFWQNFPPASSRQLNLNSTFWDSTDFKAIFPFSPGIIFSTVFRHISSTPSVYRQPRLRLGGFAEENDSPRRKEIVQGLGYHLQEHVSSYRYILPSRYLRMTVFTFLAKSIASCASSLGMY